MDALRQAINTVRTWLGKLRPGHMINVALVALVAVLVLVLVGVYSSRPDKVALYQGAATAEQQQWAAHLATLGVAHEMRSGEVFVNASDVPRARAAVSEAGLLPNDKSILFENVLRQQSWTNSRQQNDALFNNALENELSRTIERFEGVKSAKVFLDAPPSSGLGAGARRPTASALVITRTGEALRQSQVDAIASLISGSKAGLTIENVRVVDGQSGRQRRATSEEESLPTTYLEHAARVEAATRDKVVDLLSYIPGVVVAVTAQVDVTRVQTQTSSALPVGQGTVSLTRREESTENSMTNASRAAEPGVRANQTADISFAGGNQGSESTQTSTTSEMENAVGRRTETTIDPRGFPTMVAISVNVPRNFVAALIKASAERQGGGGEGTDAAATQAKEPTDDEVLAHFEQRVRPVILASIAPQVRALSAQGGAPLSDDQLQRLVSQSVGVSMIPVDIALPVGQSAGLLGSLGLASGSGGGGGLSLGDGLLDKVILGVFSLVALGMMFSLVKKSGKKPDLPTAEEIVGLPPPIEGGAEVVGEADESDTAMAGIEVGEEQMQTQKKLEQVATMVDKDAEGVARMLNRWIQTEE